MKQLRSSFRSHPNKVPPFKPDPEHWTRKRHSWKAKVPYPTEDDALLYLQHHPHLLHAGYRVYRCRVCQKWHVGRLHAQ